MFKGEGKDQEKYEKIGSWDVSCRGNNERAGGHLNLGIGFDGY